MAGVGHIALDGTKVTANASKHKAMSYGRMKTEEARLAKEIAEIMAQVQATDSQEDEKYGKGKDGNELPEELERRETRLFSGMNYRFEPWFPSISSGMASLRDAEGGTGA